jgi:dTDP-4-dehydrorhamnose reductase
MKRVLVLGANGMLGSMLAETFRADRSFEVVASTRRAEGGSIRFDAETDSLHDLLEDVRCDWVVNALGVLARRIDADDPASVASALAVNSVFPNRLAAATSGTQRVIHFSTDGVFSGREGPYDENAVTDAHDVYGLSKCLGEARAPHVLNVRCSIVGLEHGPTTSLLGWALSQPEGGTIVGYSNQLWNGLTTLHVAKICSAVVRGAVPELAGTLHLVPGDAVTKADLLTQILEAFGRRDVRVRPERAGEAVDRRLSTAYPAVNDHLWTAAGYPRAPEIADMIHELATKEEFGSLRPGRADSLQSRPDAPRDAHSRDTAGPDQSQPDPATPF